MVTKKKNTYGRSCTEEKKSTTYAVRSARSLTFISSTSIRAHKHKFVFLFFKKDFHLKAECAQKGGKTVKKNAVGL